MTITVQEFPSPAELPWWVWPFVVYAVSTVAIRLSGGRRSPFLFTSYGPSGQRIHKSVQIRACEVFWAWVVSPFWIALATVITTIWVVSLGVTPAPWDDEKV